MAQYLRLSYICLHITSHHIISVSRTRYIYMISYILRIILRLSACLFRTPEHLRIVNLRSRDPGTRTASDFPPETEATLKVYTYWACLANLPVFCCDFLGRKNHRMNAPMIYGVKYMYNVDCLLSYQFRTCTSDIILSTRPWMISNPAVGPMYVATRRRQFLAPVSHESSRSTTSEISNRRTPSFT